MINVKSVNKRLDLLKEALKTSDTITSYEQLEAEEGNVIEFLSKCIGKDFIGRLKPINSPLTPSEAMNNIMGVLTNQELEYVLEMEV